MASLYELVGGDAFFVELVDRFYAGVADDPVLRPLYPDDDLDGARARLTGFLVQYWGGPTTYSEQRGHPRLRLRHAPFPVDVDARDRWLHHMRAALAGMEVDDPEREELLRYFESTAEFLRNRPD